MRANANAAMKVGRVRAFMKMLLRVGCRHCLCGVGGSAWSRFDKPLANGVKDQRRSRWQFELSPDCHAPALDILGADVQNLADFSVSMALGDQSDQRSFLIAERGPVVSLGL